MKRFVVLFLNLILLIVPSIGQSNSKVAMLDFKNENGIKNMVKMINNKKFNSIHEKIFKEKLDSILTYKLNIASQEKINISREVFSYEFNFSKLTSYILSEQSKSINYKRTIEFNSNGDNINEIMYNFDSVRNDYLPTSRWISNYLNGNLIEFTFHEWVDSLNSWIKSGGSKMDYDFNHNLIQIIYVQGIDNEWQNLEKYNFNYDSTGKLLNDYFVFDWNPTNSNWQVSYYVKYNFNLEGEVILEESYYWNTKFNKFRLSYNRINKYNNQNKIVESLENYDVKDNGVLESKLLTQYYYDSIGNLKIVVEKSREENMWHDITMLEYKYDKNNNTTSETTWYFDDLNNNWKLIQTSEHEFDLDLLPSDVAGLDGNYDYYRNKILNIESCGYCNTNSIKYFENFYYSDILSNVNNTSNSLSPSIYPNPATDYLFIDLKEDYDLIDLSILSLNGKKVVSKKINGNCKLDISNLENGIYFLNYKSIKISYSQKFIKV